ncbi:MAG TPA: NAD(P)H-quinone oxidoreductase [Polyangiaceae bacterium]|nr:NAD(P)H-quinone oxidoreductase [Polyangiaceae bacterium]
MLALASSSRSEPLELRTVAEPKLGPHSVLIEVHAAGINRADLLQRRGLYPPPPGESEILGLECSGVVRSVGREVQSVREGERVMALLAGGAYAELVAVHESLVLPVPARLPLSAAAAVPEAFLTAYEALFRQADLKPGERVLIHAGASGVGSAAIQIARELGAFVFATTRGEKLERLETLGAERPIDYQTEDFAKVIEEVSRGNGVDVILDLIGGAYAERNQACLARGGRWISVGLLGGARANIDLGLLLRRCQTLRGMVMRSRPLPEKSAIVQGFRRELWSWLESARIEPIVDRIVPWQEAESAHERMEQNLNVGKIVLAVRGDLPASST